MIRWFSLCASRQTVSVLLRVIAPAVCMYTHINVHAVIVLGKFDGERPVPDVSFSAHSGPVYSVTAGNTVLSKGTIVSEDGTWANSCW